MKSILFVMFNLCISTSNAQPSAQEINMSKQLITSFISYGWQPYDSMDISIIDLDFIKSTTEAPYGDIFLYKSKIQYSGTKVVESGDDLSEEPFFRECDGELVHVLKDQSVPGYDVIIRNEKCIDLPQLY